MNTDLTGKNAIVCGSTQGIGEASAKTLAEMGATVILVARNSEKLEKVKNTLSSKAGQTHQTICADFTQPESLRESINAFVKNFGNINILVNNTGGPAGGPIVEAKTNEFEAAFTQHLICNHIMVAAVKEGMIASGYGRIINIISTSVKQPLNGLGVSNTIRGAVASWSKTLANELGVHGITVNNVLPGATNTIRLKSIIENKAQKTGQTIEAIGQAMANQVPMKRVAEAQEIANAVAFLSSPAASYVNGINLPVDGGRTASL